MDIKQWKMRQKELKMTYQQIADKAGVSKRTIEDIFRGYTLTPRIDTVQAIERALGLDREASCKEEFTEFKITPTEFELIQDFRSLSEDKKLTARAILRTLAELK